MDLGPPPARRPVCAMLICLLGAARCSGDGGMCPCPEIPGRNDTLPPARSCFQVSDKFRYICKEPNLRKAGTSGLTKCKQESKAPPDWSPINLQCIADPNRTTRPPAGGTAPADLNTTSTRPPESPVTTAAAPSGPQRSSSEPTSPGLQAPWGHSQAGQEDAVRETEATPPVAATSTAARAGIGFASVATVGALIGLGFFCYKRRSQSAVPQETPEEEFPMNTVPSEL